MTVATTESRASTLAEVLTESCELADVMIEHTRLTRVAPLVERMRAFLDSRTDPSAPPWWVTRMRETVDRFDAAVLAETAPPEPCPGNVVPLHSGHEGIEAVMRIHEYGGAKERPYIGQSHTYAGKRGRQTVPPITLRDLADVVARTFEAHEGDEERLDRWSLPSAVCLRLEEDYPMDFHWLGDNGF